MRQRYFRPDLPATLQAGLTGYTDWPTASSLGAAQHNSTVIRAGNPDLVALVDYVRYQRPRMPAGMQGRALSDPRAVPDQELLRFLGAAAGGA